MNMYRRQFLAGGVASLAVAAPSQSQSAPRLGLDLFSVRTQKWSPFQMMDYCARWKVPVAFFSEASFLGGLEADHLTKVRAYAAKLGLSIEFGTRSFCPSSKTFKPDMGTPEEQATRMIQVARAVGSPILRTFLGSSADRMTEGGIERHIENLVRVLKSVRSRAMDAGVKFAIENHSGDMQARELKMLIEEAGKDYAGACIDSGNSTWTLEDPYLTLEVLAPYVLTSHIRDSALWRVPEGVAVRWTRLGEGDVDIERWMRKFAELCPGKTLALEILVTRPRVFPFHDPSFWGPYRNMPAWEFARFLALAERGKPQDVPAVPKEEAAARELEDVDASLRWAVAKFPQ